MEKKIIAVDGVSNAGKTTLCTDFEKNNWKYIHECMKYVPNTFKPATSLKEDLNNIFILTEIERKRIKKAQTLASEGYNVILDRSILSTLAVSYALKTINTADSEHNLLNEYLNISNHLTLPENIIILIADYSTLCSRNNTRNIPLNKNWMEERFNLKQTEFFRYMDKKTNSNLIYIDTTNLTKQETFKITCEKIKEINKHDRNNISSTRETQL